MSNRVVVPSVWTRSYLWRWGIWQVEAYMVRISYRATLLEGGAGL